MDRSIEKPENGIELKKKLKKTQHIEEKGLVLNLKRMG